MKKLTIKALELGGGDILTRAQMRNIRSAYSFCHGLANGYCECICLLEANDRQCKLIFRL